MEQFPEVGRRNRHQCSRRSCFGRLPLARISSGSKTSIVTGLSIRWLIADANAPRDQFGCLLQLRQTKNLGKILRCSRICSCQSTQEPQGSTGMGVRSVSISIKSTYFLSISTGFHKRSNLLWEQRAGGSNPSAPTIINLLKTEPLRPYSF